MESLHVDLVPFITEGPLGEMIHHPLLISLGVEAVEMINRQYEAKKTLVAQAMIEGEYKRLVWFYERPYRLRVFMEIEEMLSDEAYWELAGSIWIDSENIWQELDSWEQVFNNDRSGKEFFMSDEDRDALAALDDTITVYRGAIKNRNEEGLSWSLDYDVARRFADRYSHIGQPLVLVGQVKKTDVIAYLNGRNEKEIVTKHVDSAKWGE
jgi:hypothetical protein